MRTRQMFKFKRYNDYRGCWDDAAWLLMPKEVEHFHPDHVRLVAGGYKNGYVYVQVANG